MMPRIGPWLWLALGLGHLLAAAPVWAVDGAEGAPEDYSAALCEQAIANGARRGGVPPEVLHAVALTETGRNTGGRMRPWPWAINREGKGYWFKSQAEALAFGKESLTAGRPSFDVGCVQINYRWHGQAFPSLEQMFDPEYTATYAAQFLRNLYEERGSWSEAAGAYHSLTPDKAGIYRERFDRILAGLDPNALPDAGALVARAEPARRHSTRQERREAQRRAMAERIARAGPPLAPLAGSIAPMPAQPLDGAMLTQGTPLLTQGSPLLTEGRPLLTTPGGGLF